MVRSRLPMLLALFAMTVGALLGSDLSAQSRKNSPKKKAPVKPKTALPTDVDRSSVEIAPLDPALKEAAIKSAAKIDELVEAELKKRGIAPNPMTTDEQFVRRAYLDFAGTIPTSKQAEAFLRNTNASKRANLIEFLLNRPSYASQMYNWTADMLRLVDKVDNNTYIRPYSDWVKECLRENTPWDVMVHDMLTAEGQVWDNPAVGFYVRDQGMPLDNLNNSIRIFLGTRIGCAQCHDHPFDKWTQKEFYQLAAFVGGVQFGVGQKEMNKVNAKQVNEAAGGPETTEARLGRFIVTANRKGVMENPKRQLTFPKDYQYDDAKPGQVATPTVLWGKTTATVKPENRRTVYADWVTSNDNPRFAQTIANRLWAKAMGRGLIEPLDDMQDGTVAVIPPLMEFLSSEMKRVEYDLKEFQRIIYLTKTYQRQVTYDDLSPTDQYVFPGPVLRRMTAEEVWDSLLTLSLPNPDGILRPDDSDYTSTFDISDATTVDEILKKAKQLDELNKKTNEDRRKRLYKGAELVRASELPQPLPDGHLLRQFGQSDRGQINESHTDGTVPQLLTMFNGSATHMMLEKGSVIYNEVVDEKTPDAQIERIFLCLLSRKPAKNERLAAAAEIKKDGAAGIGNVIWALLNTREFLFVP
jgi:hypothetical protein